MPFFFLVTAQRKQVPRKTRGTRLRIGCLILSCKVFLNEFSPREHLVETLRVVLDLHVRQIFEKEADIISGCKVVCLCCFHNAVDHRTGPCPGRRVTEQPVLSADSMNTIPMTARRRITTSRNILCISRWMRMETQRVIVLRSE